MRKILGNGLRAFVRSREEDDNRHASLFLLGPSDRPDSPYATEAVLEIEIDGERFLVPAVEVKKMFEREKV